MNVIIGALKRQQQDNEGSTSSSGTCAHSPGFLPFAREHKNWQVHHWCPVLFTDKSRFTLSPCDRRERVWRCCGEGYAACIQHDEFGGGSVVVWEGIFLEGCTDPGFLLVHDSVTTLCDLIWPECVCRFWMMNAFMPLTGPYVPQTWLQSRTSGVLCTGESEANK